MLRLRLVDIAPSESAAEQEAASLAALMDLARSVTEPLNNSLPANRGLKDLLKTAEVTRKRDRVVVMATLPTSVLSELASRGKKIAKQPPGGACTATPSRVSLPATAHCPGGLLPRGAVPGKME